MDCKEQTPGNKRSIQGLIEVKGEGSEEAQAAARAPGLSGNTETRDAVCECSSSPDFKERDEGTKGGIQGLIEVLGGEVDEEARAAARALGLKLD